MGISVIPSAILPDQPTPGLSPLPTDKFEALAKDPAFVRAAKALVVNRKKYDDAIPRNKPLANPTKDQPTFSEQQLVEQFSGGKYSVGDIDTWLRQASEPSGLNSLQKVGQGISFNFLDELRGKAKGPAARDAMRLQEKAYSDVHPGDATVETLAGSLLNPVNLALMAGTGGGSTAAEAAAPSLFKSLGLPALISAGEGQMYGMGESEAPKVSDKALEALPSAAAGAFGGVALPGAVMGSRAVKNAFFTPVEQLGETYGRAAVSKAARAAGGKKVLVDEAKDATTAGLRPWLADLTGMRGLHDVAATGDAATAAATKAEVAARAQAAPGQLEAALRAEVPRNVGTDMGEAADALDVTRAKIGEQYQTLDAAHPQVGGKPETVFGSKGVTVGDALLDQNSPYYADAVARIRGKKVSEIKAMMGDLIVPSTPPAPEYAPFASLIRKDPEVKKAWSQVLNEANIGTSPDTGRPSVTMLRSMRGKLQDEINDLFRQGRTNAAMELKSSVQVMNDLLDHETAGMGPAVDAQYRAAMDNIRALREGRDWYVSRTKGEDVFSIEGLDAKLKSMSQDERDAFRTGVASSIQHDLQHVATNKDVAQSLLNASKYRQALVRHVFDGGEQLDRYMFKVKQVANAQDLSETIGNSKTTSRMLAGNVADPRISPADAIAHPVQAAKKLVGNMGADQTTFQQARSAAIGKLTMTQGTKNIDALLDDLLKPQSRIDAFFASPATAGAAGGAAGADASQPAPPPIPGQP